MSPGPPFAAGWLAETAAHVARRAERELEALVAISLAVG